MYILIHNGVEYSFDSSIGEKNDRGEYELEIEGVVPVPKIEKGDRLILPFDEGIVLDADGEYKNGEFGFNMNDLHFDFCTARGAMALLVLERKKSFLMIALESGLYSEYRAYKENGLYCLSMINHRPCKVYYKVFNDILSLCKEYKAIRNPNAVTLKRKASENPNINKLIGGGIFWVWNDNYDEFMYSDHYCEKSPQTGDDLINVAQDLKNEGIDKAMFSIFFGDDRKYSEPLSKEFGFLTTQYDNYNDVLNPELLSVVPNNRPRGCDYTGRRMKDFPKGLCMDREGNFIKAWALKGTDGELHSQHRLCPLVAEKRMAEEVAEIIREFPCFTGRFIDVYGGDSKDLCFHPDHPVTTFEECLRIKKKAFDNLTGMGLIAATEDGFEELVDNVVYTEGLHSPACFRIPNAGRRHKNIYNKTEEKHIEKQMLDPRCRIPLWQMIYHENMLVFPYWGDSTDMSVSQVNQKVLFACLFGCQPLYSFSVENYKILRPHIISSYKRISEVSRYTATEPITEYKVLSDDYMLQRTVFGDKYYVTVNFSDHERRVDGKTIPPENYVFEIKA